VPKILERTFKFSVEIIKICSILPKNSVGYAVSNQLVRSATSIGANIEEAQDAMSRADFLKCMNIALRP
jgi:S23 ribosomal protein.